MNPHLNKIKSVAISPDGTKFATASNDWKIKIFEMEGYSEIKTLTDH